MKTRPLAQASYSALEALRNKQNKLQEDKLAFDSYQESLNADLKRKQEEILEREVSGCYVLYVIVFIRCVFSFLFFLSFTSLTVTNVLSYNHSSKLKG